MHTDLPQRIFAWLATATICLISLALSACADSSLPNLRSEAAQVTAPPTEVMKSLPVGVTPAQFHARNRMDWVGVMHNQAMDQLRADIRSGKPKDLCKVIERMANTAAVDARVAPELSAAQRDEIRRAVFAEIGCSGPRNVVRTASNETPLSEAGWRIVNARPEPGAVDLSLEARTLVNRVMRVGHDSRSPDSLAAKLAEITSSAQSLGADEAAIVEAISSLSLSSYEYWLANAKTMAAEIKSAYGPCLARGGRHACVSPSSKLRIQPTAFRLAANRQEYCAIEYRFIGEGDLWGAGVGLTIGLKYGGGIPGALIGLFAGAFFGSGGAATYELVEYVYCAFQQ